MSLAAMISQFGYPALVVGLLLEGETVLVLAAFMAHRGYLNLPLVIVLGGLVSFASDQFFYWLGYTRGSRFLEKRPAWKFHVEKAKSLLEWNTTLLFLGIRFMYGLRTVLPIVIGMAKLDSRKFTILNLIGSFLWALTFGLAGSLIGNMMGAIFEDVREHEVLIFMGIILVGVVFWLYRRSVDRKEEGADHSQAETLK